MLLEIHSYKTKPGQREQLIELFETVVVPASGMSVIGQFRSLDNEDMFVWIRMLDDKVERLDQNYLFFFGKRWTTELSNNIRQLLDSWEIMLLEPTEGSRILPSVIDFLSEAGR